MIKRALLLSTALLPALQTVGQKKAYIGIGLGGTFALSDFASTSASNSKAGYAGAGAVIDITFATTFGGHFGIAATLRGTANSVQAEALAQDMADALGTNVKLEVEPWSLGALLVGPYGNWPLGEVLSIEAKALIGYAQASSPRLKLSHLDGGGLLADQLSANATTFAYALGGGLKFNVSTRLCLLTGVDYLAASAEFTDVQIKSGSGSTTRTSFKQPYSMINVVVALAYRL